MDRGAWWATVLGVPKSWTQLSNFHPDGLDIDALYAVCGDLWKLKAFSM